MKDARTAGAKACARTARRRPAGVRSPLSLRGGGSLPAQRLLAALCAALTACAPGASGGVTVPPTPAADWAAVPGFSLVSPAEGAAVSLHTPLQAAFLSASRADRRRQFTNAVRRVELAAGGWHPQPVTFAWTWRAAAGTFHPVFTLEVVRAKDGLPVALVRTAETNAVVDNLDVATAYRWRVTPVIGGRAGASREGRFTTDGNAPRLVRVDGVYNSRDLGGWRGLGGRRVRQGLVFRTGGLNNNATTVYCTAEELEAADTNGVRRARAAEIAKSLAFWSARTNGWDGAGLMRVDVGRDWTLFRVPEADFVARGGEEKAEALRAVPATFLGAAAERLALDANGTHVFPFDTRERLVICRAFDAPQDGYAVLGASADWFWSLSLNGRPVADFRAGNRGNPGDAAANRIPVAVRAGRNLLVAVVKHGMAGCTWSCRGLEPGEPAAFASARAARDRELLDGLRKVVRGRRRGADFVTDAGRRQMLDELGVRTEIDLRTDEETAGMDGSPLGPRCRWAHISSNAYAGMKTRQGREAFAAAFRLFLDPGNYAIDFHCIAGQDRTGTLSFILLALLGVGEEDLYRDWEATAFWNRSTHFRHANAFDHLVEFFGTFEGTTLNDRVEAYVKSCGFTEEEIARFRELMLEEAVAPQTTKRGSLRTTAQQATKRLRDPSRTVNLCKRPVRSSVEGMPGFRSLTQSHGGTENILDRIDKIDRMVGTNSPSLLNPVNPVNPVKGTPCLRVGHPLSRSPRDFA